MSKAQLTEIPILNNGPVQIQRKKRPFQELMDKRVKFFIRLYVRDERVKFFKGKSISNQPNGFLLDRQGHDFNMLDARFRQVSKLY